MTTLNFFFWNYVIILIYVYIEIFYNLIFFSTFKSLKSFNLNFSKKVNYYIFKNQVFSILIIINIVYILTLKLTYTQFNMISFIFVYLIVSKIFETYQNYNIMFLNFNIIFFILFLFSINSIVTFFLFIEMYSILFYFFFLNNNQKLTNNTLLQFKNMLLMYLINNFFVTSIFLFGISFIIEFYGTLNFTELSYISLSTPNWQTYLIIIAFFFKLALPGFHFLKLEIYKYLDLNIVILYSTVTIFINYLLILLFFNNNFIYITLNAYKLINILPILSFLFLINKIKLNNFQEFIAYSGFATNNLILLNFVL